MNFRMGSIFSTQSKQPSKGDKINLVMHTLSQPVNGVMGSVEIICSKELANNLGIPVILEIHESLKSQLTAISDNSLKNWILRFVHMVPINVLHLNYWGMLDLVTKNMRKIEVLLKLIPKGLSIEVSFKCLKGFLARSTVMKPQFFLQ